MKKLILWDIDGTLINCGNDGTKALNITFKDLYDVEDAFSKVGIGSKMDYDIIHEIMWKNRIPADNYEKISRYYCESLKQVLDKDNDKKILEGVVELLEFINSSKTLEQALITSNMKSGAVIKLKTMGLYKYFIDKKSGFGDESGEKWHVCEKLLEHYGFTDTRENVFIIGDGAYDIETSKKLGIKSIAVATGWTVREKLKSFQPDHFFENLKDTVALKNILVK